MAAEPLTIAAAAPLIRSGELTPSELLEQCLRRIDLYEPAVQAWVYLDRERARRDAARLTDEARAGRVRGPLHGVPVGVKDIIDVFDMPTGCGSKLWANSYARRDATVVERLRQAGAVILGKTVTTPYAYLDPPPTRNPWDLSRTPGGSSSGSAVAVACGMCLAALGTQTGGSTIRPAAYCGICSLKPTYDRLPVDGVLPLAASLDHIGLMARTVPDLIDVYRVVACHTDYAKYGGISMQDPLPVGLGWGVGRTRRIHRRPLAVQVTADFFPARTEPAMLAAFGKLLDQIDGDEDVKRADPLVLPSGFSQVHQAHLTLMAAGAATVHRERIERHPDDYPPRIRELIELGQRLSASDLAVAQQAQSSLFFRFTQRDEPYNLLLPATPGPPPDPATTGDPSFNSPWSLLGFPVVSFPFARTPDGLPLAAQLVGERFTEHALLQTAEVLESEVGFEHRLPPVPG